MDGIGRINLEQALGRKSEPSDDTGIATGGSNTTCEDTIKNWPVDHWNDGDIVIIKADTGIQYFRNITSNIANTITFDALPVGIGVVAGDTYCVRKTGFDAVITVLEKLIPIAKAAIFNTALPAAEANWLGADIVPTNSPSYLRIHVAVAVAGFLRVARTVGGVTVVENLNASVPLVANSAYAFNVEWRTGDSLNFRYSATGANILVFRANEIGTVL